MSQNLRPSSRAHHLFIVIGDHPLLFPQAKITPRKAPTAPTYQAASIWTAPPDLVDEVVVVVPVVEVRSVVIDELVGVVVPEVVEVPV